MESGSATFRFYADLLDFFPAGASPDQSYSFHGTPSVKDAIESQGIPHPEVDRILINSQPVELTHLLVPGARIEVYPSRPGHAPTPDPLRFILDVNLGKLARWLRLLGFDSLYRNDYDDHEVADLSAAEDRVALTRDRRLLFRKQIEFGYWVRADDPFEQVLELSRRYDLNTHVRPLHRCTACNGLIGPVSKDEILDRLEPKTKRFYDTFFQCGDCGKVYWKGSHYDGILEKIEHAMATSPE